MIQRWKALLGLTLPVNTFGVSVAAGIITTCTIEEAFMTQWRVQEEGFMVKTIAGLDSLRLTYTPITVAEVGKDGRVKEYRLGHSCDRKHYAIRAYPHDRFVKQQRTRT